MINTKLVIIGKQASGKTTVAKAFEKKGMRLLKTHTTRKRRFETEDAYHFVDKDKMPSNTLAKEQIGENIYYTCKDDVLHANVMILTPSGLMEVANAFPDIGFHVIYVIASEKNKQDAINERLDKNQTNTMDVNERDKWEENEFEIFDQIAEQNTLDIIHFPENISRVNIFYNEFNETQTEEYVNFKYDEQKLINNLIHIVDKSSRYGVVDKNEKGLIKVLLSSTGMNEFQHIPLYQYADFLLNSEKAFQTFICDSIIKGVFTEKPPKPIAKNQIDFIKDLEN